MTKTVFVKDSGKNCPYNLNYCPHVKPYRKIKCPYSGEYCEKKKGSNHENYYSVAADHEKE